MQATLTRKSKFPAFLLALVLFGALMLGGMGGYILKSIAAESTPALSRVGAVAGSSGPTSSKGSVDPFTGFMSGSADDRRILDLLKRSGYEGGGTVVHGGSPGSEGR